MLRHLVLMRVRADVPETEVHAIFADLKALKDAIPGLVAVHCGANVSPEGLGRGYGHAFTVDFEDAAARDRYLIDPALVAVGRRIVAAAEGGVLGLAVVDFET